MTTVVLGALLLAGAAGCGSLTVEEKYAHLRDVANKGADAHYALINENKKTDRETCDAHYKVFVPDGAPAEDGVAARTREWTQLSADYFGDSCVKGQPREIQTRPQSSPATPPSTQAPASEAQPPAPAAG